MKIVHITTIDVGGAYKAAVRISKAMSECGADCTLLLRTKTNNESLGDALYGLSAGDTVRRTILKSKNVLNQIISKGIDCGLLGADISNDVRVLNADVIVLHWINSFLSYNSVKKIIGLKKKVIIVLHDMWFFTAGCHIDSYCGGYESNCKHCPKQNWNIAHILYKRKADAFAGADKVIVVGPSMWITNCAKKSSIVNRFDIRCIHNPIDNKIFKAANSIEVNVLKNKYSIPLNRKIVLFGAMNSLSDPNKGYVYLKKALEYLSTDEYFAIIFGGTKEKLELHLPSMSFGNVESENELAYIYSIADVFVAPSLQESFSYTVCEALCCGTKVVAFPVGGIIDQIEHKKNGYLAEYKNPEDMARGIRWVCEETNKNISERIMDNDYECIGRQYMELCTNNNTNNM